MNYNTDQSLWEQTKKNYDSRGEVVMYVLKWNSGCMWLDGAGVVARWNTDEEAVAAMEKAGWKILRRPNKILVTNDPTPDLV